MDKFVSQLDGLLISLGLAGHLVNLADGSQLEVLNVVRVVPGKRIVCRCVWSNSSKRNEKLKVYAKIFIGREAGRYAERDKNGIQLLEKANIRTPRLFLDVDLMNNSGKVLIFDEVINSINTEQSYSALVTSGDAAGRFNLMSMLVDEVASHHNAQLIQTDLYLKNFLVQNQTIYTLDGDGVRRLPSILRERQKLHNLATLFSKMDVLDDCWIAKLYERYCSQLTLQSKPATEAKIWYLTQKVRRKIASSYADKKVFRTCTDVNVMKDFRSYIAVTSQFDITEFSMSYLDAKLSNKDSNLKNGNTCTISKLLIEKVSAQGAPPEEVSVVVKRYNIKSFWHGLNRAFRVSRAAISWANAHRLMVSGVATPKPVALIEERYGWIKRQTYFLSECLDASDALQYFAGHVDKESAARSLATLFYRLYLLKFSHGDCKATNIKMLNGMPVLIDLDGMKAHSVHWLFESWFKRRHIKDLQRLMKNWEHNPDVTAILKSAFIQKYNEQYSLENDSILRRAGIA